VHMIN